MNNSATCYIKLFHGRQAADEQLDDWGSEGPVIGPVGVSWTYGNVKVHDPSWDDFEHLPMQDDLVAYDGAFYGDFEVLIEGDPNVEKMRHDGYQFHDYSRFAEAVTALKTT